MARTKGLENTRHQIAFSTTSSMRSDYFRFEIYSITPNQITGLSDIASFLFQNDHSSLTRAKDGTGQVASIGAILDCFYSNDASTIYGHEITNNTTVSLNDYCVYSVDKITQIF